MSAIDASVVVPVYNPGVAIEPCIDSLLAQSLPADRLELIFVNDGSTDGTDAVLDRLAAAHPQVRVIHQEGSGWAGKPRNVGAAAATGRFVQFVDQDDMLAPEALDRLVRFGDENGSDIVIGKVTSNFRRVPQELFRHNVPRCSVRDTPLIRSLTPHKMFRRQFLAEHGLRYAEGRVRLEDQLFMAQAYFATDAVGILADYPCYFYLRREDGKNSAATEFDPADYYRYLREVLDVVEANTEPGEYRDGLHERFLNAMLRKLSAAARHGNDDRLAAFQREISGVVRDRFAPDVTARPAMLRRQIAAALLTDRHRLIRAAVRRLDALEGRVQSADITLIGSSWQLSVAVELTHHDGSPVRLQRGDSGWRLDDRLAVNGVAIRSDSTEELLARTAGDLLVRSPDTGVEWLARQRLEPTLEPIPGDGGAHRLLARGTLELDPATFAAGGPLEVGTWLVSARIAALGVGRTVAIRSAHSGGMKLAHLPGRRNALRYGANGKLKLVAKATG
jgi:glycosyltransferase involved in cell wall biosynthesis